jgi:MFS family permease
MTQPTLTERRSVVVSTLGITQTLAWGSTYYLTAVFADPISAALDLPRVWFFGIFSAALLLSGLLGPLAGRMIDKYGGRDVLAATNLVFAAGLVVLACARGPMGLAVAWAVLGAGMGFGLYEAAFATVAGLYGRDARNSITGITLFAGFASTVGWPTSAIFIDMFGWRGACLAWAALHLLIGLPMNRLLVPKATLSVAMGTQPHEEAASGVPWTMIVLASVFGATWFVSTAMAAHLPRLLQAMGSTPAIAVAAASLVGPAQVAARLVEFGLLRRLSPMISARLATGLHPLGATLLAIFGPVAAIPFVLMHGGGNGMLTIARGTLPLALFGPTGYGLRTGILSAPARILQGGAPVLFGIVLDRGGPLYALLMSGTLTGLSFLALFTLSATPAPAAARADG